VVDLFAARRAQSRCMLGTAPCDTAHPCAAHECWTALMRARREPLATTTIATLLGAGLAVDAHSCLAA
jgi:DNA-binding IscR family transcriptional regulator